MGYLVVNIVIFALIYYKSKDLKRSAVIALFGVVVGIIGNKIGEIVFYNILNIESAFISQSFTFIMLNLIILTIVKIIVGINKNYKVVNDVKYIYNEYFIIMTTSSILAFLYFILTFYMERKSMSSFIESIIITLALVFIIILGFGFYRHGLKEQFDSELLKRDLASLKEYSAEIESITKDMRAFKHDYKNVLLSLNDYIENNKWDELRKYFNEEVYEYAHELDNENLRISLLSNIKITPLKGLISAKILKCNTAGIEAFIDIQEPIEDVNMNVVDLCRIIGNLLDNALEGAERSKDKALQLGIINKKDKVLFVIKNSCGENVPQVHEMFKSGYSTNGENRGIGLSSVKELIDKKYDNVTLSIEVMEEKTWVKQVISVKGGEGHAKYSYFRG